MDALASYRQQWEARFAKARAERERKPKHRQPPVDRGADSSRSYAPRQFLADPEVLKAEYLAGASTVDLSRKYGVSQGSISHHLRKVNTPIRDRAEQRANEAMRLYKRRLAEIHEGAE